MTPEQFQRAERLFLEAAGLSEDRRKALLDEVRDADPEVRELVDRMLRRHTDDSTFLEPPPVDASSSPRRTHDRSRIEIDGYEIVRVIAHGGSAIVYEAWQTSPRRKVALKVPRSASLTEHEVARFEREIRILAELRHPGIAQIYAAGTYGSPPHPFFAMEFVEDARPLLEFADDEQLDRSARIDLALDICDAVDHGHARSVVHRDLKPDNLLVGPDRRPKVIDFGVAWTSTGAPLRRRPTAHGQLVGSFATMSPEQWAGRRDELSPASDVYALGVILHELLTGRTPIDVEGCTLAEAADRVASVAPSATGLPRDLDAILMRALEKSPRRRYARAGELADDLRRFVAGRPVGARPARAPRRIALVVRRYPARTLALLLATFAVVLPLLLARSEHAKTSLHEQAGLVTELLENVLRSADPRHRAAGERERDMLAKAARDIDERFGDFPETEATLRRTLGETYASLGMYAAAEEQLQRSLFLHREHFADESPRQAGILHATGSALVKLARFDEAETLLVEAIARKRRLSDAGPSLSQSLGMLAECRFDQGAYEDSEQLYREALARLHATHEAEDASREDTASSHRQRQLQTLRSGLANALVKRGELDEAEAIVEEILTDREGDGTADDLTTAALCHNLGAMRIERQDFAAAERLLTRALTALRKHHEPDHPDIGSTLNALSIAHLRLGQEERAERELVESIAIRRAALGNDHPELAGGLINLAAILKARGATDEAEARLREALRIQEAALGPDHPDLAFALLSLANTMAERGEIREAITRTRRAVGVRENALGDGHLHVAIARNQLGELLTRAREYDEARPLLERSEAVLSKSIGPNHWLAQVCSSNLALLLAACGDAAEAERRFRRALRVAQREFGPDHASTARCRLNLASALIDLDRFEEAETLLRSALASMRASGAVSPLDLSRATLCLGRVLHAQQKFEEAATHLAESIEITTGIRSSSHWQVTYAEALLGSCESRLGRIESGTRAMRSAYERLRDILGTEARECREVHALLIAGDPDDVETVRSSSTAPGEANRPERGGR